VLTDNGIQFTNRALDTRAFAHIFDRVCSENGIEHRLTKMRHLRQGASTRRIDCNAAQAGEPEDGGSFEIYTNIEMN
jgi:hypothetical protein